MTALCRELLHLLRLLLLMEPDLARAAATIGEPLEEFLPDLLAALQMHRVLLLNRVRLLSGICLILIFAALLDYSLVLEQVVARAVELGRHLRGHLILSAALLVGAICRRGDVCVLGHC